MQAESAPIRTQAIIRINRTFRVKIVSWFAFRIRNVFKLDLDYPYVYFLLNIFCQKLKYFIHPKTKNISDVKNI